MFVQQFFVKGLAHSSYLLGGTNTCAIIDPRVMSMFIFRLPRTWG